MATTVSYSATLRARIATATSNVNRTDARYSQLGSDNHVGIICFDGLNLSGKVIQSISLTLTAGGAGYGAWKEKTIYFYQSNYQNVDQSGVTGLNYVGSSLGSISGSFRNNTTTYTLDGTLLGNQASYLEAGNNTLAIYDAGASVTGSDQYSDNFLNLTDVQLTVTYEEGMSQPTTNVQSADLGTTITISTNRSSTEYTHNLTYSFGGTTGSIGTNVGADTTWTPLLSLAAQIPNATSGVCTITCQTYYGSTLIGSRTCTVNLTVPASVVPTISSVTVAETNSTVTTAGVNAFVRTLSIPRVAITAAGAQGSSISNYRVTLDGLTYNSSTSPINASRALSASGSLTLAVTVTDTRGRTATYTDTITVLDYSAPEISLFTAERCSSDGSTAQTDGNNVRVTATGQVSALGNANSITCSVYYQTYDNTDVWALDGALTASGYVINAVNTLLSQTYDALKTYNLKIELTDLFTTTSYTVRVGTKTVMLDFRGTGDGLAIGKISEQANTVEVAWPLALFEPLPVSSGGTGASTAAGAVANLFGGSAIPIEQGGTGADTAAGARTNLGADDAANLTTGTLSSSRLPTVTISKGGTSATTAAAARYNLGTNNAANITTGTLAMARLPFKLAYGHTDVGSSTSTAATLDYSSAGFTNVPHIMVCYSTELANVSGNFGALKVYNKTATSANVIVGGSISDTTGMDWIAIGT